jgi:hypothetical protein
MANPYLREARPPLSTDFWSGGVAAPISRQPTLDDEGWIASYGATMCEVLRKEGYKVGSSSTFSGDVTAAKSTFNSLFDAYENPGTRAIRDFGWKCFVEGFEQGRAATGGTGGGSSTVVQADDDGWGLGTWLLVIAGVGTAGLFGYNLWQAK